MRRREFIAGLVASARPLPVYAQPDVRATARVGVLTGASISSPSGARFRNAFVEALRQRGWEEGKNLVVQTSAAEGKPERGRILGAHQYPSHDWSGRALLSRPW